MAPSFLAPLHIAELLNNSQVSDVQQTALIPAKQVNFESFLFHQTWEINSKVKSIANNYIILYSFVQERGVLLRYSHCVFLLHVLTVGVHQYIFVDTVAALRLLPLAHCCCLPSWLPHKHIHLDMNFNWIQNQGQKSPTI